MEEISNRMISGQLWKVEAGEAGGRKERKGKERVEEVYSRQNREH